MDPLQKSCRRSRVQEFKEMKEKRRGIFFFKKWGERYRLDDPPPKT
jgi:hypothetical protein